MAVGSGGGLSAASFLANGDIPNGTCGQVSPNAFASRTPDHGRGGRGGMNRESPAVDAPYGMPKKRSTLPCARPSTVPPEVRTRGEAGAAACALAHGIRDASAPSPNPAIPLPTSLLLIMKDFHF